MSRILLFLLSILLCPSVFAESSHASMFVKTVEEFSIFPAEQPNNGVYRDGKLLLQSPSVQWLDLIQVKDTDSWLASGIDEEGKYYGHLLLNENDKLAMTNQGYGVYDILKKETGILEIYRTHNDNWKLSKRSTSLSGAPPLLQPIWSLLTFEIPEKSGKSKSLSSGFI